MGLQLSTPCECQWVEGRGCVPVLPRSAQTPSLSRRRRTPSTPPPPPLPPLPVVRPLPAIRIPSRSPPRGPGNIAFLHPNYRRRQAQRAAQRAAQREARQPTPVRQPSPPRRLVAPPAPRSKYVQTPAIPDDCPICGTDKSDVQGWWKCPKCKRRMCTDCAKNWFARPKIRVVQGNPVPYFDCPFCRAELS